MMIPARAGSKRVKNKNLRLLSGNPLISYVINTCKEVSKELDIPVYVNSDCEDVLYLAEELGVNTYKRKPEFASDTATNDEFMLDFMENTDSDHVLQVLPTSPFITKEDIKTFIGISADSDTVVSVKDEQIGCVYENTPLNFSKGKKNPPSQEMTPIKVYTTSLMCWNTETFKKNMSELGSAYHGGNGKTVYHTLKGWSTIDIDTEDDFLLAENIAQMIPFQDKYKPFYYERGDHADSFVPRVLKDDGLSGGTADEVNKTVVNVKDLMETNSVDKSWFHTLVNTENNSCTIVNQLPGEGNRRHYHAKWNEWWYILRGTWDFEIEGVVHAIKEGDLVFIEKGNKHHITATGDTIASRLAVSRYDVEHIYKR